MVRKVREAKLETRTARLKLEPRRKPYFTTVAPGISLGYRRNAGAGSWVVRGADGEGGNWTKAFGTADDFEDSNSGTVLDFWQSQDKARELARGDGTSNGERPATVGEAIENYAADLAARGGQKNNADTLKFNVPASMQAKTVALLTTKELRHWRNGMVTRGVKSTTANRVARAFKACLNLAAADDPRISDEVWRTGLKKLPEGDDDTRNVILSDEQVRAVVAASYSDSEEFGRFFETLAGTGARESQLLRLNVGDILDSDDEGNPALPRLDLPSSRKGKDKKIGRKAIQITPRLALVLKQAAVGRTGMIFDPLVHIAKRFREATKHLKLDPGATPYCLRHSNIVRMLKKGTPTRIVASYHDTSVAMIEKHYSKFIVDVSDEMIRATLLDFNAPTPSNVVPMR
jgi:integrase